MKVRELIAKLQGFDPEMRVVVSAYEDGFNELNVVVVKRVKPWEPSKSEHLANDISRSDWQGELMDNCSEGEGEPVVVLPRRY